MDGVARALPFVLVLLVVYLAFIRPIRTRAKETATLQSMLSPGDQIMLTSGIFGRVESVVDDKFTVEIAPDVVVTVHRGAIGKIVRDVPDDDEAEIDGDDAGEVTADDAADLLPDRRDDAGNGRGVV